MVARSLTRLLAGGGLAAILLLTACAPITRVVLLPQADGSASSVIVKSAKGEQILSTPYQAPPVPDTPHQIVFVAGQSP